MPNVDHALKNTQINVEFVQVMSITGTMLLTALYP